MDPRVGMKFSTAFETGGGTTPVELGDATVWGAFANPAAFPTENLRNNDIAFAISTMATYQYNSGTSGWEIVQVQNVSDVGNLPTSDVREGAFATVNNEPYLWNGSAWIAAQTGAPFEVSSFEELPEIENLAIGIVNSGGVISVFFRFELSEDTWLWMLGYIQTAPNFAALPNGETFFIIPGAVANVNGTPYIWDNTKWTYSGLPLSVANYAALPDPSEIEENALCVINKYIYRNESQTWELLSCEEETDVSLLPVEPTQSIRLNAVANVVGNPFLWNGTKWSNQILDLTTWSSRPRNVPDGTWGVGPNGRVYRFSQTNDANDLGDWVPPEVYAGSVVFRGRIVGDVVPSSESPAWTHKVEGTGTVTQTGSVVRFTSTTGGPGQQAMAFINHGVSGGKYYMAGYLTASSLGETLGVALAVRNGTHLVFASTGNTSGNGWQASTAFVLLSPKFATFASNVERWVELLWHNGVVTVLVDHTVVSMQLSSAFDVNAGTNFFIGDPGHFWRGILDVRQLRCVTF